MSYGGEVIQATELTLLAFMASECTCAPSEQWAIAHLRCDRRDHFSPTRNSEGGPPDEISRRGMLLGHAEHYATVT